jgi:hypothetical protein
MLGRRCEHLMRCAEKEVAWAAEDATPAGLDATSASASASASAGGGAPKAKGDAKGDAADGKLPKGKAKAKAKDVTEAEGDKDKDKDKGSEAKGEPLASVPTTTTTTAAPKDGLEAIEARLCANLERWTTERAKLDKAKDDLARCEGTTDDEFKQWEKDDHKAKGLPPPDHDDEPSGKGATKPKPKAKAPGVGDKNEKASAHEMPAHIVKSLCEIVNGAGKMGKERIGELLKERHPDAGPPEGVTTRGLAAKISEVRRWYDEPASCVLFSGGSSLCPRVQ